MILLIQFLQFKFYLSYISKEIKSIIKKEKLKII